MIGTLSIGAGYLLLIAQCGALGLLAAAVHIGIMLLAAHWVGSPGKNQGKS